MAQLKSNSNTDSRRVLVFNLKKRLAAIYASRLQAAKALDCRSQVINNACDGQLSSYKGMYLRWWDKDIEIDAYNELGILSVKEYDEICGIKRPMRKTCVYRQPRESKVKAQIKAQRRKTAKDERTDSNRP